MFESPNRIDERYVLPDSNNIPASESERFIRGVVSLDGLEQLWIPVASVDSWVPAVIGARMPETPVDEDSHSPSGEHDIWANSSVSENEPKVFAESIAMAVKPRTKFKLWRCVRSLDCSHVARSPWSRRHNAVLINHFYSRHVVPTFPSGRSGDKMLMGKFFTCRTDLERQA